MSKTEQTLKDIIEGAKKSNPLALTIAEETIKDLKHVKKYDSVVQCLVLFVQHKQVRYAEEALKAYFNAGIV